MTNPSAPDSKRAGGSRVRPGAGTGREDAAQAPRDSASRATWRLAAGLPGTEYEWGGVRKKAALDALQHRQKQAPQQAREAFSWMLDQLLHHPVHSKVRRTKDTDRRILKEPRLLLPHMRTDTQRSTVFEASIERLLLLHDRLSDGAQLGAMTLRSTSRTCGSAMGSAPLPICRCPRGVSSP